MDKIRAWSFPIALISFWVIAAAYAVSLMLEPRRDPRVTLAPAAVEQLVS